MPGAQRADTIGLAGSCRGGRARLRTTLTLLVTLAASRAHAAPPSPTPYGPLPEQVAEVCRPTSGGEPSAAILLIHGGGWTEGDMATLWPRCLALSIEGYTVVNMNYRLADGTPGHAWPAALDDARLALAWLRANAAALGVYADRIVVIGESAGGQLTLFLGNTGQTDGIRCILVESAPIDLLTAPSFTARVSPTVFTSKPVEDAYRAASPVFGIGPASVPTMIVHGRKDDLVPFSQSGELLAALKKQEIPATLLPYDGSHMLLNTTPAERARVAAAEISYLKECLGALR